MKVICALLCLAAVAHGANIQRIARNTEGIIPSIVEEILKVELKSDLKKNSAVEVEVQEPVVKEVVPAEPLVSRTVEEKETVVVEEKMPVVVETMVETIPSLRTVLEEKVMPEIVEKVEIVAVETIPEKPVDNFRTEPEPSVEQPKVVEVVKETIIMEPTPELRNAPLVPEIVKEEEMIKPMVRNVIKEEIPQIEELRVVPGMEAFKDIIPEPIAASNIAQPVVEVEPVVKTVVIETVKEEMPMKDEMIVVKTVPEMTMKKEEMPELKAAVVPEMMMIMEEKIPVVEMIKDEVKSVPVETEKMEETMIMPGVKAIEDGRQNVLQQAAQQVQQVISPIVQPVVNTLQNIPVVGQLVQRITPTTAEPVAPAEEDSPSTDNSVADETVDATTKAPAGPIQSFVQGVQHNVQQFFNPSANAASDTQTENEKPPQNPLQQGIQTIQTALGNAFNGGLTNVQNAVQGGLTNLQSVFRPPQSANSPPKTEESGDEAPAEGAKSAIPEKTEKVEQVEKKKEVEEEKPTETQS